MALATNTQLGSYEVLSLLGAGGMGEVYRARDTRLDRDVAIKILPDALARDQERILRFEREAKLLATLNHSNIAAVYGFEEVGGKRLLVMELAEGETLAERLKRGSLLVPDALELAVGIARALEAAHEKGIIHRDLKPANIKVTPDGTVKVLDFGLAKAMAGDVSGTDVANSPTITLEHTRPGVVLGTAAYMSPEQARGRPLDKRTDIWSFGCVLFECLSGQRPFQGATATDLIARILERDPEWSSLPAQTPASVHLLLRRCLAKDRNKRLRDIGDARVEIESALEGPTPSSLQLAGTALAPRRPTGRAYAAFAVLALTVAAISAALAWRLKPAADYAERSAVYRFAVDLAPGYTLRATDGDDFSSVRLSPDGSLLAFAAGLEGPSRIFIRDLSAQEPRLVPGTEGGSDPFFSPDGRWLAFNAAGKLKKVPVAGGPALTLGDAPGSEGAWLPDGTCVFSTDQGGAISRFDERIGKATVVATAGITKRTSGGEQPLLGFQTVAAVPGADYVLAGIWDGDTTEDYAIVTVSLTDGTVRPILQNAVQPSYVEPGYVVFLRGASVLAVRFDAAQATTVGDPILVADAVISSKWSDKGQFDVSLNGTLAYVPGGRRGPGRRLIYVDAAGKTTPLMEGTDAIVGGLGLSPDGEKITLLTIRRNLGLWTFDLSRRSLALVSDVGEAWSPLWTRDQQYILFHQIIPEKFHGLVRKRADGSGMAEPYTLQPAGDSAPDSFSPDGKLLLYTFEANGPAGQGDIGLHRTDQPGSAEPLVATTADESDAAFAPDGKHFVFTSTETGWREVFIQALDGSGGKRQVSQGGGRLPRWSRDGRKLYFLDLQDSIYEVEVDLQGGLRVSTPVKLFDVNDVATTDLWGSYDVAPDGGFIMVQPAEWETKPVQIHVVVNWIAEVTRR